VLASPFKSKSRLEAENAKSEGRFGKQDFVYMPDEDVYRCPAGEKLRFHYANEEHGQKMRRYWTNACKTCAIKEQCTTGKECRAHAASMGDAETQAALRKLADEYIVQAEQIESEENLATIDGAMSA
jgi:hypothetical protein